jgi:hypothetical protein
MNLLNELSKQAADLWKQYTQCQNNKEKEVLLERYLTALNKYKKQRAWFKAMES